VHALLQQTPSTQNDELHCVPEVHADPLESLPPHEPPMQVSPAMQSVSTVHDVLHDVEPHVYGAHGVVTADGQFPAPSQFAPAVAVPPLQLAVRQLVDVGGYAQALDVPLQLPPQGAAPDPVHAPRAPCGCPLGTLVHAPTAPETSHAWHCPPHAALQHTPSTQNPEPHCAPLVQAWPLVNELTHVCGVTAVSHSAGDTQSVSAAHVVPHVVPLHM
jgi:hypothetical protein